MDHLLKMLSCKVSQVTDGSGFCNERFIYKLPGGFWGREVLSPFAGSHPEDRQPLPARGWVTVRIFFGCEVSAVPGAGAAQG